MHKFNTRNKLAIGCVAGLALVLSGCGDAPERNTRPEESTYANSIEATSDYDPEAHFDWAYRDSAPSWDPIKSTAGSNIVFFEPVYDRLLYEEVDGTIAPMLATDFSAAEDGSAFTLTLREGLTFSDGEPFDGDAVKFNLDRARAEGSTLASELAQVENVEVVDEHTVTLHLSGGVGPIPATLAARSGIMVSPAAADSGQLDSQPVGIGAYTVTNYVPGDKTEYEATPDYWDPDAQRVATMTFHVMTDDQTRLNALKSGELDGAEIPADQVDVLADDGFVPLVQSSARYTYFLLNAAKEPFDDPEVRTAINLAIDREGISQGLYGGYCTPQIHPFAEGSAGYSDKIGNGLDALPYDPEQAMTLLEDAGVTDLKFTIGAPNIASNTKLAEAIQEQLADVGIDAEVESAPTDAVVQKFVSDQSIEAITSIGSGVNDPDVPNSRYIKEDAYLNAGGVSYPDLIKYGDEGAAALEADDRRPAYEKYLESWISDPPHLIPICLTHESSVYTPQVSGVKQKANGYPDLRGVAVTDA
ncbi:ABC transporter substrate-binding protein [Cumulibacter soli]|uniref:ABC transporter substrate-binding protein n=1 Tax=Cumulibacter soli TaxID=2546344 RepID=UPI00106733D3|nr:ABC transporter substrate-binding protein [Cumulibacter soli]